MSGLHIDQQRIEQAIIEQASSRIAQFILEDHVGNLYDRVADLLETAVKTHCDAVIAPIIDDAVESFTLAQTSKFGESKGADRTFAEYITAIAEDYLMEEVDAHGKPPTRSSRNKQTRLTFLLDKRLHREILSAMDDACTLVLMDIAPALATTASLKVKEATDQILGALRTEVNTNAVE